MKAGPKCEQFASCFPPPTMTQALNMVAFVQTADEANKISEMVRHLKMQGRMTPRTLSYIENMAWLFITSQTRDDDVLVPIEIVKDTEVRPWIPICLSASFGDDCVTETLCSHPVVFHWDYTRLSVILSFCGAPFPDVNALPLKDADNNRKREMAIKDLESDFAIKRSRFQ